MEKGTKHSEETHRKMSEAQKGNKNALGSKRTLEQRKRLSEIKKIWLIGISRTKEVREKISKATRGLQHPLQTGEKNYKWKGERVGYNGLHKWINRKLGKPDICKHCGRSNLSGRLIHWANKSHQYKRELTDWIRLCAKCHKHYDATGY